MDTSHKYKAPDNLCRECGGAELDHYWKCEKCEMVGNGKHECET